MASVVTWIVVSGLAAIGAGYDLWTRRVPNALTFGTAAAGLVFSLLHTGFGGLATSLLGCLVGLVVFLPLFALGGMGAGDVKLLAAFGAWLGPEGVFWAAIWASLVGGALALVVGASRGYLSEAVRNVGAAVALWRTVGLVPVPGLTLSESHGPRLPYAVPIGIGAVLALWLGLE